MQVKIKKTSEAKTSEANKLKATHVESAEAPSATTPGIAIAAFVVSIIGLMLDLLFGLGILLSFVGLILSLVALSRISGAEQKKGKGLAIAGLILSILGIIIAGVIIFAIVKLVMLAGEMMNSVMNINNMTAEEALANCNRQGEVMGVICHALFLPTFRNESMVISGQHCDGIKSANVKSTCIIMHAQLFNTTANCEKITYDADYRQMCIALGTGNTAECDKIINLKDRKECKDLINDRSFMFENYQTDYSNQTYE